MTIKFIQYPKCGTCRKAKKWLVDNNIDFDERDIVINKPTKDELKLWIEKSGLPIKKFFNTKQPNPNETKKIKRHYTYPETIHKQATLWTLSNNLLFTYYLGITLKYIKEENKEDLKNYYVNIYSDDKYESLRDLHLLANILLILEYKDLFIIQEKLNSLFLNLSANDIKKLNMVILKIKKYGINGNLINQCFSTNILAKELEETNNEIKKLKKTLKNYK